MKSDPGTTSPELSFSKVVEQLEGARPPSAAEYGPGTAISSGAAAQPQHEPAYVSSNALSQIYETTTTNFGPTVGPAKDAASVATPSIKPQDIARELKLRIWHSPEQILDIRRRFAMKNHPDRVAAPIREAATIRMSIANTLIDDALRVHDVRS